MSGDLCFTTPAQAVNAMIDAGAVFTVRYRGDGLGISFTYRVGDGGDVERCRAILAQVKGKPGPFFEAFKEQVRRLEGGAPDA